MLKNRIIPCLDVKDGKVVKGVNFENLIDAGDPVAQAKFYYQEGADELCFLDISASQEERGIILEIVQNVAKECFIPFTVGGGIRNLQDFSNLLASGADKVSINSAAIKNPQLICDAANKFGSNCVVVAIDAKKNSQGNYEIFTHGGKNPTGLDALFWAKEVCKLGAGEILLTSMDKDGTKSGYDLDLIKIISSAVNVPIIASGGVGKLEHLAEGILSGADAVLAASIFHFRQFSIKEAKDFLNQRGVKIRPQS